MKCKFKYIALALASVLLCFLMTGCEGDPNAWKFDLEGNEIDKTTYSSGSKTITRTYVVNSASVNANGRALAAQEVKLGDGDMVSQVSRLYVVNKESMENALSLPSDTNTERYVIITFHYSFPDRNAMDSAEIEYRNDDKTIAKIKYDSSLAKTDGEPNTTIINGSLTAIMNYAVNDSSFQNAMRELSQAAYDGADEMIVDAMLTPEIAD